MRDSTSIRVTRCVRDDLRTLAAESGVTLDVQLSRLVRAERQRRMGVALSKVEVDDEGRAWIDRGVEAVRRDAGG